MKINKKICFRWTLALLLLLFCGHVYFFMIKPILYKRYFQRSLLDPTLIKLNLYSKSVSNLLLGTAMQESCLGKLSGNVFQIKLKTAEDVYTNYLAYRPELNKTIAQFYDQHHSLDWNLNNNIRYQIALARIIYLRIGKPLPDASNSKDLAQYWKQHYNTYLGKGTAEQYEAIYNNYFLEGYWRCTVLYQWNHYFKK